MVLVRVRVIVFSILFRTSSSFLSPSIRRHGAVPTRRADVAAAPRGAGHDAPAPVVRTRRAALGGALALGGLLLGGPPEQAAAVGWDYDAAVEALPADRRITAKVCWLVYCHNFAGLTFACSCSKGAHRLSHRRDAGYNVHTGRPAAGERFQLYSLRSERSIV